MEIASPLQAVCLFFAYGFLGWCVEVAYHAVTCGSLVNRGFLNGPICPIYGFGMLGILLLLEPLENNLLLLFIGGMAITTAIELVGGFMLYKLFHTRWWDYSDLPMNLGGYICAQFSLYWGLGTLLVIKAVHPTVLLLICLLPAPAQAVLCGLLGIVFLVDIAASAGAAVGLDRQLRELDEIRTGLRKTSDLLTEKIGTTAMTADEMLDEKRLQLALAAAEGKEGLENLREEVTARTRELGKQRDAIVNRVRGNAWFGEMRLLKAFPKAHRSREGSNASLILLRGELAYTRLELKRTRAELDKANAELERLRAERRAG